MHVGLDDDAQFLDVAGLQLLVQLVERDACTAAARHLRVTLLALAIFHDVASLGFVGDLEVIAGIRNALQAENFHGGRRRCVNDRTPAIIKHGANFSKNRTADKEVAGLQRAVLHQHGSNRTAAFVYARFEHRSGRGRIWIGFKFAQIRNQENCFQQLVQTDFLFRGNFHEFRVPAPLRGHQADFRKLALHAIKLSVGLINFIDGHDDGYFRGSRVINGLLRLRHDAVVGSHHQHHDVGNFRAT